MNQSPHLIAALALGDAVTEADVRLLRREVLADGMVTREQAEALCALDACGNEKCDAWTDLFVEAITDHVVWQARPTGVVTRDKAEWLLARAEEAQTPARLAALVNILAEAHQAPVWFVGAVRARAATWPGLEKLTGRIAA